MSKIAGLLVMFAYPRLPDWQAATRTRAQDFSGQLWPNHGGGMQVNPVDVFTLPWAPLTNEHLQLICVALVASTCHFLQLYGLHSDHQDQPCGHSKQASATTGNTVRHEQCNGRHLWATWRMDGSTTSLLLKWCGM
jgi:hypothetical protein